MESGQLQIDLRKVFRTKHPGFLEKYPNFLSDLVYAVLENILHIKEINKFFTDNSDKQNLEFIEEIFDYLDFGYLVSSKDRKKIPAEGKIVIVANHPLGALDGLTLLKVIGSIRNDVKIVANDVLLNLKNIKDLFIPYNIFLQKTQRDKVNLIKNSLLNDEAVIFFPAAEVSRLTLKGIRDRTWQKGPIYFARKLRTPVLPIYVKAKNSLFFYFISLLSKNLSMFLLANEIIRKRSKSISIKIGDPIPSEVFTSNLISTAEQSKLLKHHVYKIGKNKPGVFKTEKTIIHPIKRKSLKRELSDSELLAVTPDGKKLFLVEYKECPNVMKEISRLREVTFRRVGEGTGNKSDLDKYDKYFKHIILWEDDELEIAGSYRLGVGKDIINDYGVSGFYNSTLFNFSKEFLSILERSFELGRSFIQQKYWRSNALDYLWMGLGSYVSQTPNSHWLFGGVSISDSYSETAKSMIAYFYRKWYGTSSYLARAKNRFVISKSQEKELKEIFIGEDYKDDFRNLKINLKNLGYTVPVLFRKYSELCEPGGVKFLDFCVDPNFSNTVDGLILLDLSKLDHKKKKRYLAKTEKSVV